MKITRVETLTDTDGAIPALTFVRLFTDDGAVGLGETFYTPRTVTAYVHEVLAPLLLGRDVTRDGWDWDDAYARSARRIPGGVDLRAQSAIDLAVWDLRGKVLGRPVSDLLGAVQQDGARVYNTCAGARYATATSVSHGQAVDQDDLWLAQNDAGALAKDLLEQGFVGMKLWPFDAAARTDRGARISSEDLAAGVATLTAIREAVGPAIEIMVEGHGLWQVPAAAHILRAIEHLDITWAEDMVLAHAPDTIADLSRRTTVPLAASEYVGGHWAYRQLLEARAVGFVHVDPSWCGGISEAQRILALASSFGVTASMHDCTGPMNLLAGLHLARANSIVGYQEVLRAFLKEVYPTIVDTEWSLVDGRLRAPDRPGLGADLTQGYLAGADIVASEI
jgi:galactonate dehydratase